MKLGKVGRNKPKPKGMVSDMPGVYKISMARMAEPDEPANVRVCELLERGVRINVVQ